jgi:hypothetical protein
LKPLRFLSGSTRFRWWREFRLFWLKDSHALSRRNPVRTIRTHGILLGLSVTTLWVLARRLDAGQIAEPLVEFFLTALVVTIGGLLAMRSTLGKLGMEGSAVLLLHPVISRRRLLGLKLVAGAIETALLTAAYSLVITILALALGFRQEPRLHLILEGVGWGLALVPVGAALGFLLPDFRDKGLFLLGASTPSKVLFASVNSIPISCYLLARWVQESDLIGVRDVAAGGVLAVGLLVGITLLLLSLTLRNPSWRDS